MRVILLKYSSIQKEIKQIKDKALEQSDFATYFMCGLLEKFFEEIPMIDIDMNKVIFSPIEDTCDYVREELSKLIESDD